MPERPVTETLRARIQELEKTNAGLTEQVATLEHDRAWLEDVELRDARERVATLEGEVRATQITGEKVTLISEDDGPFQCVTCGVEPERVRQMAAELERLHGILDGGRSGESEG